MVAGMGCSVTSVSHSTFELSWAFRISGLGTHRQLLVFKSPFHALHPVPKQIFLLEAHPNKVSSEDKEQEPSPLSLESSPSPCSRDGSSAWWCHCSQLQSQPLRPSSVVPSEAAQLCNAALFTEQPQSCSLCWPILHICLPTDGI